MFFDAFRLKILICKWIDEEGLRHGCISVVDTQQNVDFRVSDHCVRVFYFASLNRSKLVLRATKSTTCVPFSGDFDCLNMI